MSAALEIVTGLEDVGLRIHASARSVRRYAARALDPLPLRRFRGGKVWGIGPHLDEWNQRFHLGAAAPLPRLVGAHAIAREIGRETSEELVIEWSRLPFDPIPVFDVSARRGDLAVHASALRDWCYRNDAPYLARRLPADPFAAGRPRLLAHGAGRRLATVPATRAESPQITSDRDVRLATHPARIAS